MQSPGGKRPQWPGGMRAGQFDLFARPTGGAAQRVVSVSDLTRELKGLLEGRFLRVSVRGEISNFKPAASGHLYFTLKDDGACIAAVMFRNDAARLRFPLKDGLSLVARGRITVYEPRGQYQLVCDQLEPEGAGALALRFEALKAKLAKEGLFDVARKRPVPFLPKRIGVVTSPSGAAIRDFLRVLHDRFPIPVLLAPARVQGEGAAEEIARGIQRLAASGMVDVVVVTRGGGSIEDLWAFNEEVVARAIAACPVPVVSAVGHEVDFTIADFVADKRCATPTDAAKTLAPPLDDLEKRLDQYRRHLAESARRSVLRARERLQQRALRLADPRLRIANGRLRLDDAASRMQAATLRSIAEQRGRLQRLRERLDQAHPRARLARAERDVTALRDRLQNAMRVRLSREAELLNRFDRALLQRSPARGVDLKHRRLAAMRERIERSARQRVASERVRFSSLAAGLESLSPLKVLGRGYAIAFTGSEVLRHAADVRPGDSVRVLLSDRSELETTVVATRQPPK